MKAQLYRKNPVFVEAIQFKKGNFQKIKKWCRADIEHLFGNEYTVKTPYWNYCLEIGDWLVKDYANGTRLSVYWDGDFEKKFELVKKEIDYDEVQSEHDI